MQCDSLKNNKDRCKIKNTASFFFENKNIYLCKIHIKVLNRNNLKLYENKIINKQNYLKRFKQFVKFLERQTNYVELIKNKTFDGITDNEIQEIENKIGYKLNNDLLSYFKESNGYKLLYKIKSYNKDEIDQGKGIGAIYIPSLQDIFNTPISNYSSKGKYRLKILGGKDDFEIRNKMFLFDKYDVFRDESIYNAFYYVIDENVLLLSDDYEACITDVHPITIQTYMELSLANAFLTNRINLLSRSCDGNYKIIDYENIHNNFCSWDKLINYEYNKKIVPEFSDLRLKIINE